MPKIIVVGSSNTDMVIQSARIPRPGETILGGSFFMNPGGKGANQAVAAARLGGEVHFICKVGQDVFGDMARKQFIQDGIHAEFVISDSDLPSGVALINVDAQGENSITVASGANGALSMSDIEKADTLFDAGDVLLIQLETPLQTVWETIKKAHKKGLKVILNPAPAAEIPDEIYPYIFALTPNETEMELLTGIAVDSLAKAQEAAQRLLNKGLSHLIITMGSQGAYYQSAEIKLFMPTQPVQALDTTAAGDCFNGALAVAISQAKDWESAIQFACEAATRSVTKMGAQASMPYLTDLS
ncbi:MAG: Sulfofructose kinase [Bacteroidota bacterium]